MPLVNAWLLMAYTKKLRGFRPMRTGFLKTLKDSWLEAEAPEASGSAGPAMLRLVLTRLALFLLTLLAASLVLFIAINVVPGSAARSALGVDATPQAIMRFEAQNGLDRPLYLQYGDWLGSALRGDFGISFQNRVPVGPEILKRLPVTMELALLAFLIANLIAVPLGALAALFHQRRADTVISGIATIFGAIPNFWLATLLVLLFALTWRVLPSGGYAPLLR